METARNPYNQAGIRDWMGQKKHSSWAKLNRQFSCVCKEQERERKKLPQIVLVQEGDPSSDRDNQHSPNMISRDVSEYLNDKNTLKLLVLCIHNNKR